jgi:glycerol kinase
MGLDTTREDMMQALLEGVALRAAQALKAIGGCVTLEGVVSIDGGLTRNNYFCQFLARALGRVVRIPATPDLTGLGCAQLAWIGSGLGDLPPSQAPLRTLDPQPALDAALSARFADAVERSRRWREA